VLITDIITMNLVTYRASSAMLCAKMCFTYQSTTVCKKMRAFVPANQKSSLKEMNLGRK
jgi:hypothetical protein